MSVWPNYLFLSETWLRYLLLNGSPGNRAKDVDLFYQPVVLMLLLIRADDCKVETPRQDGDKLINP